MPKRIIHDIAQGDSISSVWLCYVSFGGMLFGLVSIPSSGGALILIPMFLTAGAVIGCGMITHLFIKPKPCGRYIVQVGLALMILASWTRAFVMLGVDQGGAGSEILASFVWVWITIGFCLLFISVWLRRLS